MREECREKIIPATTVKEIFYIASDGNEFKTWQSCYDHEIKIGLFDRPVFKTKIKNAYEFEENDAELYYISSKKDFDDLNTVEYKIEDSDFDIHGEGWYIYYQEDCDSYYVTYLYHYDTYVKDKLAKVNMVINKNRNLIEEWKEKNIDKPWFKPNLSLEVIE